MPFAAPEHRLLSLLTMLVVVLAAAIGVATATAQGAGPTAVAAKTCSTPKYPGSGYFTSLSVTNVGCATGKKFVVAYYKCRTKKGKAGRCRSKVMGYTCKETRNTIPTEINARVTCKYGSKKIVHTYQQNT